MSEGAFNPSYLGAEFFSSMPLIQPLTHFYLKFSRKAYCIDLKNVCLISSLNLSLVPV